MISNHAFIELIRISQKFDSDFLEKSSIKKSYPELFNLLIKKDYREVNFLKIEKYSDNSRQLSRDISEAKGILIKERKDEIIRKKYEQIALVEAMIELDLEEDARDKSQILWQDFNGLPTWQKWQLIELEMEFREPLDKSFTHYNDFTNSIKSLAYSLKNISNEVWDLTFPELKEDKIYGIINYFRTYSEINHLIKNIEEAEINAIQYKFETSYEIKSFKFEKNYFFLNRFFNDSFKLLSLLIKNDSIYVDNKEKIDFVISKMNDFVQWVKQGSFSFGPNLLTIYFQNEIKKLEIGILMLPKNPNNDGFKLIHPDVLFESNFLKEQSLVYEVITDILIFDGYEHDLDDLHLKLLDNAFNKLHDLLNEKLSIIKPSETKIGLMCMYILFVRCLRKISRKYKNYEFTYQGIIEEEEMTETRFKGKLPPESIYKLLIDKNAKINISQITNIIQLACYKLHHNL